MAMILITKSRPNIEKWGRGKRCLIKDSTPVFIESSLYLIQFLVQACAIFTVLFCVIFWLTFVVDFADLSSAIGGLWCHLVLERASCWGLTFPGSVSVDPVK